MNDIVCRHLRDILSQYGRGICDDPRRLRALLTDLCPGMKRETHVLVSAAEQRIPAELANSSGQLPWELEASRLARRLVDDLGLADDVAAWAVEVWAIALGRAIAGAPVSQQKPRKSVPATIPDARPADQPAAPRSEPHVQTRTRVRPNERVLFVIGLFLLLVEELTAVLILMNVPIGSEKSGAIGLIPIYLIPLTHVGASLAVSEGGRKSAAHAGSQSRYGSWVRAYVRHLLGCHALVAFLIAGLALIVIGLRMLGPQRLESEYLLWLPILILSLSPVIMAFAWGGGDQFLRRRHGVSNTSKSPFAVRVSIWGVLVVGAFLSIVVWVAGVGLLVSVLK